MHGERGLKRGLCNKEVYIQEKRTKRGDEACGSPYEYRRNRSPQSACLVFVLGFAVRNANANAITGVDCALRGPWTRGLSVSEPFLQRRAGLLLGPQPWRWTQ